jgi:Protein of unknown function (DUF1569)
MKSLYDRQVLHELEQRVSQLTPSTPRQWGKMDAAQMLAHCAIFMEMAAGDVPVKQILVGKILGPFVKRSFLAEKPFDKNGPTGSELMIKDAREFATEKARLLGVLGRFSTGGASKATKYPHGFIGPLTGEQWGTLTYKHIDHHLRQFGV